VKDTSNVRIGAKTKVPGLWTISALQDIAESEIHFDDLKNTWKSIWDKNNDESWRDKFSRLKVTNF